MIATSSELSVDEIRDLLQYLTPEERAEFNRLIAADKVRHPWRPLPGPQTLAYHSAADIIGYGGAAGGGKTDLACGLAMTKHHKAAILRREATQLTGVIDRLTEIIGDRKGYNGQDKIWRLGKGKQIEFGSTPNAGDETKYQGRPKDLLVLDETTNFLEAQVRFLMGWVRTTKSGQKCTTLLTFNPPTDAEGRWIIDFFAPWLDETHPNPAVPGELRWMATVPDSARSIGKRDIEVPDATPFVFVDGEIVYDFNPKDFAPEEIIKPQSRTFIPSKVSDNPYLMGTGYVATLQSLPEPLRSQMLNGDFKAGMEDDMWQIIPTAWVKAAQDRWKPRDAKGPMDSIGTDPCRGGRDKTSIARRHGAWFDEMRRFDGTQSPDGPTVAAQVIALRRDRAPVHIDMTGWGASPYDFLVANNIQTIGVNFAEKSLGLTAAGNLKFVNRRAEIWWRMREALDPANPHPIALPPDSKLLADLCAPKWSLRAGGIQVESKEEIIKRLGRSPDDGDAVCLALIETVKDEHDPRNRQAQAKALTDHDPLRDRQEIEYLPSRARRDHDPYG